ncbi:RagB/SusD family nutrient uptake outer membrane protein [Bacteroides sp.]|uniref:RagB/SusD family nutrient uptake outer membrane protein n=1 Tax=Bacteroides sp. TaxID=29523 RepID=UPI003A8D6088
MKKVLYKYVLPLLAVSAVLMSCNDFLDEQDQDGKYDEKIVWESPKLAEGVLLKGYQLMASEYATNNQDKDDFATSDMVTNVLTDGSVDLSTGQWTSRNTFLSYYDRAYQAMVHINDFLAHVDGVDFAPQSSQKVKDLYIKKLKGEAFALRAWWGLQLLRAHSGKSADGQLLGYPIVTQVVKGEEAQLPRDAYAKCVEQIFSDCDRALECLPLKWEKLDDVEENRVMGLDNVNRINGLAVKAIKSRVAVLAASDAFKDSGMTWREAAELAADVMNDNGGISNLDERGLHFYNLGINDRDYMNSCNEIFWYSSIANNNTRESRMYAPSLYGEGVINPSQNLVDCFGDSKGYPLSGSMLYNAIQSPFANRDPRLKLYIYCDGEAMRKGKLDIGAGSKDAPGTEVTSSRTGYYLRKLLDETSDLTPATVTKGYHYRVHARYTEVLLNFAEAANEAVGPDAAIGGFTARNVVNAIRKRAGITDQTYVNSLDKEGLKLLIRNERRIELCFENFRFWDIRRWMDMDAMNETVRGIRKNADGTYAYVDVEERKFEDYMIYAPIPYSETLKYDLVQNMGWE